MRKNLLVYLLLAVAPFSALSQSMSYADVLATGAKPLSTAEAKAVVTGAKTVFKMVNGSTRDWTNETNGTFIAARNAIDTRHRSARGTWSVNEDAAYCLTFDWGAGETEQWPCRRLYKVGDAYYGFAINTKPEAMTGKFVFSR